MGVYNAENTLRPCLDSILAQSFQSWEFIICDDCSTDSSSKILSEYKKKDERFVIIRNESNLGLAASLNKCSTLANAPILARQDADDTSDPNRLELQLKFFNSNADISVLGTFSHLVDHGNRWGKNCPPESPKLKDWLKGSQVIHASSFIRKSDFEKLGGYNENAIRAEDVELWFRFLEANLKIKTLPEYLYNIEWSQSDYKRKKIKYRFIELKYMALSFKRINLPIWKYFYLLKNIIALITPKFLLYLLHKKRFKKISAQVGSSS